MVVFIAITAVERAVFCVFFGQDKVVFIGWLYADNQQCGRVFAVIYRYCLWLYFEVCRSGVFRAVF